MRMPHADESDLEWFLGEGECVFMRSTVGAMLDRAKTMSSIPLRDDRTGKRIKDKFDRYVAQPTDRPFAVADGADLTEIDAQPTGGRAIEVTPDGAVRVGNDPPHNLVVRYASVSRRLSKVGKRSVTHSRVLEVYYGDAGSKWGRTKYGRIFSLYARTPAGAQLVIDVEAKEKSPVFLTDDERLGVIAGLQGIPTQSKAWRKRALVKADEQAWALYRAACVCWLEVANAHRT